MDESERPGERRRMTLAKWLAEPDESSVELPLSKVRTRTRRDFLLWSAGALFAAGGSWWLLPDETREHHLTPEMRDWIDSLEARLGAARRRRERFLNRVLTLDDDVAEALYSPTRSVRTYSRSDVTPLRNNYNGATPTPAYLPGWTLTVSGLSSGRVERLGIADMLGRFAHHEQVTRLFCVEGWSAIAWWGGLRFADLLLGARRTPRDRRHARPVRAPRAGHPAILRRGVERNRLVGRAALRRSPAGLSPTARRALGEARILGQPGRRRQSRSVLRVDRPADRSTPANPARYASVRKDAPGRTRRAPAAARADETRTQEHQGYHLDRLLRRGAGRLLERARLLQVRRAVDLTRVSLRVIDSGQRRGSNRSAERPIRRAAEGRRRGAMFARHRDTR